MKTYKLYIRNAMTKYLWYFTGTIRAHSIEEAQEEVYQMSYRNPDSEYKIVEM